MKKWVLVALCSTLAACNSGESDKIESQKPVTETGVVSFKTEDQKASYALGLRYGEGFASDLKEIDLAMFHQGLQDGFKGSSALLNQEQAMEALQALQARKMEAQQKAQAKVADDNKVASEAFLAQNKARPEVTTTESGLQYEVITQGNGATPTLNDAVNVHYHGTLPDGSVFDSSVERGEPISFPVTGVIKGWTEALQLMKVGDKRKLYIPSDLAYGPRGSGAKIGPNQALVFEVELLGIEKAE